MQLAAQDVVRRIVSRLDQRGDGGKGAGALDRGLRQKLRHAANRHLLAVRPDQRLVAVGPDALEIQGGDGDVGRVVRPHRVQLGDQAVGVGGEGAAVGVDVVDAVAGEQGGIGHPLRAEAPHPVLVGRDVEQAARQNVAARGVVIEELAVVELFRIGVARPDVDQA